MDISAIKAVCLEILMWISFCFVNDDVQQSAPDRTDKFHLDGGSRALLPGRRPLLVLECTPWIKSNPCPWLWTRAEEQGRSVRIFPLQSFVLQYM